MKDMQSYILFPNHDNAMRLYQLLKKVGVKARISPTPRSLSKCCGVSLMIDKADVATIMQIVEEEKVEIEEIAEIEQDFNPKRDKYC